MCDMSYISPLWNGLRVAVFSLTLALAPSLLHASSGLIANADFELGVSGTVSNWGPVGKVATLSWVTGTAGGAVHSGSHAVAISGIPAGSAVNQRWVQLSSSLLPLDEGQSLEISAWIKGSADWDLNKDGYRIVVEFLNGSNAVIGNWVSETKNVNLLEAVNTWKQYTHTSTPAPANAVKARISLVFGRIADSTSSSPTVTFDDIHVVTKP